MLETTSKTVSKCIQFEKSKEKIILSVSIENIDNQKIWKTKDFLEAITSTRKISIKQLRQARRI